MGVAGIIYHSVYFFSLGPVLGAFLIKQACQAQRRSTLYVSLLATGNKRQQCTGMG